MHHYEDYSIIHIMHKEEAFGDMNAKYLDKVQPS